MVVKTELPKENGVRYIDVTNVETVGDVWSKIDERILPDEKPKLETLYLSYHGQELQGLHDALSEYGIKDGDSILLIEPFPQTRTEYCQKMHDTLEQAIIAAKVLEDVSTRKWKDGRSWKDVFSPWNKWTALNLNPNLIITAAKQKPIIKGIFRFLTNAGANVNAIHPKSGRTALHFVAESAKTNPELAKTLAKELIDIGANIEIPDAKDNLPIDLVETPELKKIFKSIFGGAKIESPLTPRPLAAEEPDSPATPGPLTANDSDEVHKAPLEFGSEKSPRVGPRVYTQFQNNLAFVADKGSPFRQERPLNPPRFSPSPRATKDPTSPLAASGPADKSPEEESDTAAIVELVDTLGSTTFGAERQSVLDNVERGLRKAMTELQSGNTITKKTLEKAQKAQKILLLFGPDSDTLGLTGNYRRMMQLRVTELNRTQESKEAGGNLDDDSSYEVPFQNKINGNESGEITFDEIAGLDTIKHALEEATTLPLEFAHLYNRKRESDKGILMYGPPGTGKTLIAKACANDLKHCKFLSIDQSDIKSPYQGQAVKKIRAAFKVARDNQPCILFIDECENLAADRNKKGASNTSGVVQELLTQMQGASSTYKDRVIVIGATNLPYDIDDAILRRFQNRIFIGLPNVNTRKVLLIEAFRGVDHMVSIECINDVANQTQDYSGSDLSNVAKHAINMVMPEMYAATQFTAVNVERELEGDQTKIKISQGDVFLYEFIDEKTDVGYKSGLMYMPLGVPGAIVGEPAIGISVQTTLHDKFIPARITDDHLYRALREQGSSIQVDKMALLQSFTEKHGRA